MTETTSPQLMNLSPGLGCHKNALEIAAGQSGEGREEGMCLIRLGKARELLARVRKEQGARPPAAKIQTFCMAHAGGCSKKLVDICSQLNWQRWKPGLSG